MKSFVTSSRLVVIILILSSCADGGSQPSATSAATSSAPGASAKPSQKPTAGTTGAAAEDPLPPLAYESGLPEALRAMIGSPFTGDLDEMEARRMIRVGVTFNRTHYFVDRGTQRGLTFVYLKRFEEHLNAARKTRNFRIHVVVVPMQRDLLLRALTAGQIDAVAAQKTITEERQQIVDFSIPYRRNVSEVVVTAPGLPAVKTAEDLSGHEVFVRRSSSYAESLRSLNQQLERDGRPPVTILDAPENLEDDDILEMVNAGLIDITVVDDYLAEFWSQIFTGMNVHKDGDAEDRRRAGSRVPEEQSKTGSGGQPVHPAPCNGDRVRQHHCPPLRAEPHVCEARDDRRRSEEIPGPDGHCSGNTGTSIRWITC